MSTSTVIQAAAAVYGVVPGNAFVTTVNQELATVFAGDENALLNHYYQAIFTWNPATSAYDGEGGVTTQQIAEAMAINMGFTGEARTTEAARLAGELESVGIEARGAKTKELIDAFEAGGTELATAFTALKNTVITSVADPSYTGISVTLSELGGFASLKPANITLGTTDAINEVALAAGAATTTGTAGIDIISGVVSSLSAERTLDQADSIDGGEGTNDILNVAMKGNFSGFTAGTGGLKGVETVALTNDGIIARSFDATGIAGVQTFELNSSTGTISLASLAEAGISVKVNGQKSGDLSVGFGSTAATSGSSDALSVSLNGVGATSPVALQVGGIDNLTLASIGTGTNKVALGSANTTLKTITVNGNAATELSQVASTTHGAIETIDASTLANTFKFTSLASAVNSLKSLAGSSSSDNTITIAAGSAALASVTTGSGKDSISADWSSLKVDAAIDGGSGAEDTLTLTGTSTRTLAPVITGIETLVATPGTTGATLTIDSANVSGLQTIQVGDAKANVTLTNVGSGDIALSLKAGTSNVAGPATVAFDNTGNAVVTLSTTSTTAGVTNALTVTPSKAVDLQLTSGAGVTYTGTLTAAEAKSVSLKSEATTTTLASGFNAASITADKAELISIDSQGALLATVAGTKATTLNIAHSTTATSPAAQVTFTTPALESLTLSAANQPITLVASTGSTAALQILSVTSSKGTVTLPTMPKLTQGTITGTGTGTSASELAFAASAVIGGTATTSSESLGLTISGFDGGTSGTQPTISAQGNISLNLSGLTTGTTDPVNDIFTLGAVQSGAGSIDLTVNGASSPSAAFGNFQVGGSSSTITLTLSKVNADVTTALTSAGGKVTYTGPANKASTVTTAGANTVEINGGSKGDTFTITGTGSSSATTLLVSGNLGFADDKPDAVYINGTGTVAYTSVDVSGLSGFVGESYVVIGATSSSYTNTFPATVLTFKGSTTKDFINIPIPASSSAAITVTGGAGEDIFHLPTVAVTNGDATAAAASTKWSLTNPIIITDFNTGKDLLSLGTTSATVAAPVALTAFGSAVPASGVSNTVKGNYSAGVFTYSATGTDTLYMAHSGALHAVVLQGYSMPSSAATGPTNKVVEVGIGGTILDAYTGLFSA